MDWGEFWEHFSRCNECHAIVPDSHETEHRRWHARVITGGTPIDTTFTTYDDIAEAGARMRQARSDAGHAG